MSRFPGLDGLEATRILKRARRRARVPVIALTAQAGRRTSERASRAGCDGFIPKPLRPVRSWARSRDSSGTGAEGERVGLMARGAASWWWTTTRPSAAPARSLRGERSRGGRGGRHPGRDPHALKAARVRGRSHGPDASGRRRAGGAAAARARPYAPEVLVITAYGTIDSAVEAVRTGAFDYLTKPIATQKLLLTVDRAVERRSLRTEVTNLRREVGERYCRGGSRGGERRDAARAGAGEHRVRRRLRRPHPGGERDRQGAGGARHPLPRRARGPPLHRHQLRRAARGAPGERALRLRQGRIHRRGNGAGKASSRRRTAAPSSSTRSATCRSSCRASSCACCRRGKSGAWAARPMRRVDVRILASTNRDLQSLIREGQFREDLFYRLNVIPIVIPPLRQRTEDIIPLSRHFLTLYGVQAWQAPAEPLHGGSRGDPEARVAGKHQGAGERDRPGGHALLGPRDLRGGISCSSSPWGAF